MLKEDIAAVVKTEIGENTVQNSVLQSHQLLTNVGTQFHHWKCSMPPHYPYKTSETNSAKQRI